jgi:hypothetical protein
MTTPSPTLDRPTRAPAGLVPLLVIAAAQLMLVLDDSIVNIALPRIQSALDVAPVHLPWVVNAYILAFGALLLLGGRIGDLWGRKRALPGDEADRARAWEPETYRRLARLSHELDPAGLLRHEHAIGRW